MSTDLTPDNARFLQDQVATGEFTTGAEALNAAVDLLKRQAALRSKIQRGLKQLDNGQFTDFDEEGLDHYFNELLSIASGERPLT